MRNIAFVGGFCAGKSTLAMYLRDFHGMTHISMASNLKNIFADVYGTTNKSEDIEATLPDGSVRTMSVRSGLQILGESVKQLDRDFWMKWLQRDMDFMLGPFVMDDARLAFECDYLKDNGWLLVGVKTPVDIRVRRYRSIYGRTPTEAEMFHVTEIEAESYVCDVVVDGVLPPEAVIPSIIDAAML